MWTAPTEANRVSLYGLKRRFVASLSFIRRALATRGVRPDLVSLMAIPIIIVVGAAIVGGQSFPAIWLFVGPLCLVWMGINAIDGDLARSSGSTSSRGAVLNELIDRFGDLVLLAAGLAVAPAWLIGTAALGVFSAEMISLVAWAVLGERVLVGPMGKPDRALVVSVGAVLSLVFSGALTLAYAAVVIGAALAVVVWLRHLLAATEADSGGSS